MLKTLTLLLLFMSTICFGQRNCATPPNFQFRDSHGNLHDFYHAQSQGYEILLSLLLMDCVPCHDALHELESIHTDYIADNVLVWSLFPENSYGEVASFVDTYSIGQTIGTNEHGSDTTFQLLKDCYGFTGYPTVSVFCHENYYWYDVWPYTNGAPEWRTRLEICGIEPTLPYVPLETSVTITTEKQKASNLRLSSNPGHAETNAYFFSPNTIPLQANVIDVHGRLVLTLSTQSNSQFQPFNENLPNGLYFLQVYSDKSLLEVVKVLVIQP